MSEGRGVERRGEDWSSMCAREDGRREFGDKEVGVLSRLDEHGNCLVEVKPLSIVIN